MDDPADSNQKRLLEMFPRIIFLGIAIAVLFFFIYLFSINNIETDRIELKTFMNRLLYSDALMYENPYTGRIEFGTIDQDKFNSTLVEEKINYENNYFFAVNITYPDKLGQQKELIYHKELYEQLKPLKGLKGVGGVDYLVRDYTVTYYDNNQKLQRGKIFIEVLRTRS
jgi:hypothetical protein